MDPNVIDRARRGDKEAFTTLVLTLGDRLYSVAYRMLRDAGRATTAPPEAPCEWSADDVVERTASNSYGKGENDWVIAGERFWPSALIPYDPALADEIRATIEEYLHR